LIEASQLAIDHSKIHGGYKSWTRAITISNIYMCPSLWSTKKRESSQEANGTRHQTTDRYNTIYNLNKAETVY